MSQLGHAWSKIADAGGSLAAIAVTATFSQMAFAEATGATFPLLSDWGGAVAEAYDIRYQEWKGHSGVAKRSVFVIGTDGRVKYRWITEDALVLPPLSDALEVLEAEIERGGTNAEIGTET